MNTLQEKIHLLNGFVCVAGTTHVETVGEGEGERCQLLPSAQLGKRKLSSVSSYIKAVNESLSEKNVAKSMSPKFGYIDTGVVQTAWLPGTWVLMDPSSAGAQVGHEWGFHSQFSE